VPDSNVPDLPLATPVGTDEIYLVDDPGGTPLDKSATVLSLLETQVVHSGTSFNATDQNSPFQVDGNRFIHTGNAADPDISDNLFIAMGSGNNTLTGTLNLGIGANCGASLTDGLSNTFMGPNAGTALTTGDNNVAIGPAALSANVVGNGNVAIGKNAMQSGTTGNENTCIGDSTNKTGTSHWNTFIGEQCGNALTGGNSNTGIGRWALRTEKTGNNNVAIGSRALERQITAANTHNTAIGTLAMRFNITGVNNVAIGYNCAGAAGATTIDQNTLIGVSVASNASFNGDGNTLIGYQAGDALTTGTHNIAIGHDIDLPSATGNDQVSIGNLLFMSLTTRGTGTTISTGSVGIGVASSFLGKLHIDQSSTTAAIPPLYLDQADIDQPMIHFQGSTGADTTSSISTHGTSGATTDHIQISLNGTKAWIAVSTNNPSA
jgi:hypothetical protein